MLWVTVWALPGPDRGAIRPASRRRNRSLRGEEAGELCRNDFQERCSEYQNSS
jgi:hypothetical protein